MPSSSQFKWFVAFMAALGAPLPAEEKGLNEPPDGFVALLNGTDLNGWQGKVGNPKSRAAMSSEELAEARKKADRYMRRHWKVIDGVLVFDGDGENLCTVKEYENFELYVDWKIEPGGDSGIYLRGSPQVQIRDPYHGNADRPGSGGLFNNLRNSSEPLVRADRAVGQWNTFYIMMMGDRVSVKLNDKLVVDDVVLENYWERDRPIYHRGPIELQNHGEALYFRNIFLRELPKDPSPPWDLIFDGTHLEHWDHDPLGWRIENGLLAVSPGRRERAGDNFIWTKERYGDFILDLRFKMSPQCNSGVLIRADDRENWLHTGIEIQILDSFGKTDVGKHDCGAVYDVMAPRTNAARPAEDWNDLRIVAQDNLLSVVLNNQRIIDLDLNAWTEAGKNPDGTPNKFKTAYRDLQRDGYIGFQDHGKPVWFRDVRVKRLD